MNATEKQLCAPAGLAAGGGTQASNSKPQSFAPLIITDTREKHALIFTHLNNNTAALQTGDYSIQGFQDVFAVERKSVSDLIKSLTHERARFSKELQRLAGIASRGFARLVIVGTRQELYKELERRKTAAVAIYGSLMAIDATSVPVVWCSTPERAAETIESWAVYFYRRKLKQVGLNYNAPAWARTSYETNKTEQLTANQN